MTRPESAGQWLKLMGVLALVPLVLLCIWIWFGLSRPSPVLVLEGYQMVLLVPAWAILAGALWGRHWLAALVALFVVVSHLWFCIPAATADAEPGWVADAPTFTMFSANVLYQNPDFDAVAAAVLEHDAEVVVINEMTDPAYDAMLAAGVFDRYDTEVYWRNDTFGEMLLARVPVKDTGIDNIGGMGVPWAVLNLDGTEAKVYAIHVHAPKKQADRHLWRRNLDAVGRTVEARGDTPSIFAGDFNSTLWHGPFRDLLARGLTDGHDQRGRGLSRTWRSPVVPLRWLGPIMGLDHVLVTDGAFVTEIANVRTPGSDHRGLLTTVAVRPD
ncbi:MAG: endonuclease/exonuclease/phosphatase family protein [Actinobacteria bacterium]|nr:endonuclease/exonuclease/phosphatase family protein [Actinomycetota bacterium]